jgi:hypothetical protein
MRGAEKRYQKRFQVNLGPREVKLIERLSEEAECSFSQAIREVFRKGAQAIEKAA